MHKHTRADRFREIRDEIMKHTNQIRPYDGVTTFMHCGPFQILFCTPGSMGSDRGWNLNIWPGGKAQFGQIMYDNKVANVDWDQQDRVTILSYRSGPWEGELLALLRAGELVVPFGTGVRVEVS